MCFASCTISFVLYPPQPARIGTWPLASSTRISTIRIRSDNSSVGFSPVVPSGTRKWIPLSIWRRPSLRTACSSSSPLFVNGVTSAVPAPVNAVLIILPAFLPFSRPARPLPALPARVPPVRSVAEPQNVVHVEPAAPADNPLRGKERATREGGPVAG